MSFVASYLLNMVDWHLSKVNSNPFKFVIMFYCAMYTLTTYYSLYAFWSVIGAIHMIILMDTLVVEGT